MGSAKVFVVIPFASVCCLLKIILCAHESLTDIPFSQVGFPSQSFSFFANAMNPSHYNTL